MARKMGQTYQSQRSRTHCPVSGPVGKCHLQVIWHKMKQLSDRLASIRHQPEEWWGTKDTGLNLRAIVLPLSQWPTVSAEHISFPNFNKCKISHYLKKEREKEERERGERRKKQKREKWGEREREMGRPSWYSGLAFRLESKTGPRSGLGPRTVSDWKLIKNNSQSRRVRDQAGADPGRADGKAFWKIGRINSI